MSSSFVFVLLASCLGCVVCWPATQDTLDNAEHHFEKFIQEYNRNYVDQHEKQARFEIFKINLEKAVRMNEKAKEAVYGITQFMDLTVEEFQKYTCLKPRDDPYEPVCQVVTDADIDDNDAPDSFDWREHNAVGPVKNQRNCGSCYAFSAIGNIEGQYAIKNKKLLILSEQQVVDCDKRNGGCNGGYMDRVFK